MTSPVLAGIGPSGNFIRSPGHARGNTRDLDQDLTGDSFTLTVDSVNLTQNWDTAENRSIGGTGVVLHDGRRAAFLHAFQRQGQGNDGLIVDASRGFTRFGCLTATVSDPTSELSDLVALEVPLTLGGTNVRPGIRGTIAKTSIQAGNLQTLVTLTLPQVGVGGEKIRGSNYGTNPDINALFFTPNALVGDVSLLDQVLCVINLDQPITQDSPTSVVNDSQLFGTIVFAWTITP